MNLILDVTDLANEFMKNPGHVFINHENVATLAQHMAAAGITPFPPESTGENTRLIIMKELAASSINYCYWYGSSKIRPNDCGSSLMYELVNEAFDKYGILTLKGCIQELVKMLALNRFPLLEERVKHLLQVSAIGEMHTTIMMNNLDWKSYSHFENLIKEIPGFASDLFLKRASLFFLQLYRTLGLFEDLMSWLPVPADYQVPKMLKHFHCIKYKEPLNTYVEVGELVPKGSLMECEIRAATIVVCELLKQQTGWNISDIDSWLWLKRKECNDPFHLTVTTDY